MKHKQRVVVKSREKAVVSGAKQAFQAEIVPNAVLSGKELYEKIGNRTAFGAARAELAVCMLENFIKEELAEGNRLDFGLVSFYPRLSGALPTRDADPASEGIGVFGAVKARRELKDAVRGKLDPENELSNVRPRLYGAWDEETKAENVIVAGHVIQLSGRDIPIVTSRPDEGVWLEKRTRGKVASAEVLESQLTSAKVVFHETPSRGKYTLVVGTRCGKGVDFKVRRCLLDVRVL